MTWPTLPRAPIVEALIDIRATAPDGTDVSVFAELPSEVRTAYPVKEARTQIQHKFPIGAGEVSSTVRIDGYLFRSTDGRYVAQNRLDGFSFSRLAPYETWAGFKREARARWNDYLGRARPTVATRVGLRFVNRISVPKNDGDLRQYFHTFPDLPASLPHTLAGLFMRIAVPVESATVILTLAVDEGAVTEERVPFLLDIDAFELRAFDMTTDDDVWATLERLRELKNWFFFESITPKTKEMFE